MEKVRIIVCGGKDFSDKEMMYGVLNEIYDQYPEAEIISGHAKGADMIAEEYALNYRHNLKVFEADWKRYGRGAGPIRNREMLKYAGEGNPIVIAFWDGKSRGTANMIRLAKNAGVEYIIKMYEKRDRAE